MREKLRLFIKVQGSIIDEPNQGTGEPRIRTFFPPNHAVFSPVPPFPLGMIE